MVGSRSRDKAREGCPINDPRTAAVRRLAEHVAPLLGADFVLRLWDGSETKMGPAARNDLAFAIRSPAMLTRLVRRPRLTTLIEGFAAGDLAIEGGTLLDLAARAEGGRRGLLKKIDKRLAARALLPFLFGSGSASTSHAFAGRADAARYGQGRDDKALMQFHYDLSNAFYALFLDPEMVYTCAYWPTPETTLEQAQFAKLDLVCRKLRLQPGERLLDIGCGWGGMVIHAATHYGVHATGVTLAEEQFAYATEKVRRLGLQDRVTILLKDFRDLDAPPFDKVSSIGMYEAVGLDNREGYFKGVKDRLRPRGAYLHHAIARPMKRNERVFRRKRPEFQALVNFIFPGGELDHLGGTHDAMERNGFEIHDCEGLREHYGRTCRAWTERLHARRAEAVAEVGHAKTEIWLLYLAGCALAFERGTVGIFQTLATRRARGPSGLPPTRADWYPAGG
ncbi:SAM-dependent methyltransferase [Sabulicella rubraurantiaca]|uniref:SAM-dependent methyltransferase n=1 Tax=Sabulicella rubraurantiaca TaxID=2811429 RepID=UPI001A96D011|nr:cyclopropane-fatty-acyl-phospholipid synthase family protein [Sabulicella rubraurantiaca]